MIYEIVPAIIAKTQDELDQAIGKVKGFAGKIQLDVMDGKFVRNTSFLFDFKLPPLKAMLEAHLMVDHPLAWIEKHASKVDLILFHKESKDPIAEVIRGVKVRKRKVGIAINPDTPVKDIAGFLEMVDQVLVMTVHPGFYGSPFVSEALDKVTRLRKLMPQLAIEVDGGITDKTILKAAGAGANLFVSGSFILRSENPEKAYALLVKLAGPLAP
ncbi:ribulose-phosphate 3-epimerase [Candidatus Woesearchaeota archaeon]|nr:ribulose-phosphate 3-epimerase [Candidatus Woesearchaeota archaeon]